PFAADSFERVDAALRRRAGAWDRTREAACAATEIRHEQSVALMDARMACLGRERERMAALVAELRAADSVVVERGIGAAASLAELEACGRADLRVAPPRGPEAAEVEREVERVDSLVLVGRHKEADARVPELVRRARALDDGSLRAHALFVAGSEVCQTG